MFNPYSYKQFKLTFIYVFCMSNTTTIRLCEEFGKGVNLVYFIMVL